MKLKQLIVAAVAVASSFLSLTSRAADAAYKWTSRSTVESSASFVDPRP